MLTQLKTTILNVFLGRKGPTKAPSLMCPVILWGQCCTPTCQMHDMTRWMSLPKEDPQLPMAPQPLWVSCIPRCSVA